jgi:hypothetical protein
MPGCALDALARARVALGHLHLHGATHRVDDASELDDAPVACPLDDAAVIHRDGRVDEIAAQGAEAG